MKWTLEEISEAINGKIVNNNQEISITGIHFDSRKLQEGDLFVPIKADRDGHDFVQSAIDNGAAASFWSKDENEIPIDFPAILVEDTFEALQDFAKWYLEFVEPKVVGITGSNGKTTTKDMTAAVLAQKYRTYKTEGNYNNQIGVPFTILSMPKMTEILVLEMGMDKPGEIHALSKIAKPDVAVITMIGESHIEFFGSRAKIADAKTEILDGLKTTGTFIYDGDEPLLEERSTDVDRVKTFGKTKQADLYAFEVASGIHSTEFKVNTAPELPIMIPTPGKYNVNNALAAILVGLELNVSLKEAAAGLETFELTKNRLEWLKGYNNSQILNDAYNASPSSMKAVLDYFKMITIEGKKIIVLGDILELGNLSEELHQSISQYISKKAFDFIILYGNEMYYLYKTLKNEIGEKQLTHFTGDKTEMIRYLKEIIKENDAILVKSSFGTDLLNVVEELKIK